MESPSREAADADLAGTVCHPVNGLTAMKILYDRHATDLHALIVSRFPRVADEVCQETWLRVYTVLSNGPRPMPNFRGWLWTIARNLGTEHYRGRPTAELESVRELDSGVPEPSAQLEKREREVVMKRCYETLRRQKPEYAVVVTAFLDGEAPSLAADRLGISRANFDQRKKRALDALQQCVESRLK